MPLLGKGPDARSSPGRRTLSLGIGALLVAVGCAIGATGARLYDVLVADSAHQPSRPLLFLIGDSLTEQGESSNDDGWITQFRAEYSRSIDINSRGIGGYNSRWYVEYVLTSIEQDLDADPAPALIVIWLGANDAALTTSSAAFVQHVPLDEYKANLLTIVQRLRAKASSADFLLITPPTVDESKRRELNDGDLDRSNEQTGMYAEACVEQAAAMNLPVLDLFAHFNAMEESDRNEYFVDGLHLNSAGNGVMKQQLVSKISAAFPTLARAMKAVRFPQWDSIASSLSSSGSS